MFPWLDWNFCFGTPTDPALSRLNIGLQQTYIDIIQYIQDKRFISNLTPTVLADFVVWLNFVSAGYTALRGLQSIMEAPVHNIRLNTIKQQVYDERVRIESDLDLILNYPLPEKFYKALDHLCGVKFQNCSTVKIVIPGVGGNGVPPDLESAADVNAMVTFIENHILKPLTGVTAAGDLYGWNVPANTYTITDAMRLAYPTKSLDFKGASEVEWEYDAFRFMAFEIPGQHVAPTVATDRDAGAMLGISSHAYDPQYSTLFRTAALTDGTGANQYGLLSGHSTATGLQGMYYIYDPTVVGVSIDTELKSIAHAHIFSSSPVILEFPWAFVAVNSGSQADEQLCGSIYDDLCLFIVNVDDLVEETIYFLKDGFASGLR